MSQAKETSPEIHPLRKVRDIMSEVEGRTISQEELGKVLNSKRGKIDAVENRRGSGKRPELSLEMAALLFEYTGALVAPFSFLFPTGKVDDKEGVKMCEIAPSSEEALNLDGGPFTGDNYRQTLETRRPLSIEPEETDSAEELENKSRAANKRMVAEEILKIQAEILFKAASHAGRWDEVRNRLLEAIGKCGREFLDCESIDYGLKEWNDAQPPISPDQIESHPLLRQCAERPEWKKALKWLQQKISKDCKEEIRIRIPVRQTESLCQGDEIFLGAGHEIEVEFDGTNERGEIVKKVAKISVNQRSR
ncbi:MAG: hypothetical protein P1U86_05870 [Verrucomicrobiales bacterium]|nr:hypothetical protein [Verrucomicrobiales bacterium]